MRYAVRACMLRHNFQEYLDQLISACKEAEIDEVMMCEDNIFISAISQPLRAHKEMAQLMKEAVRQCNQAGLSCTFYLKSMIGHFTCKTYALPYTKFIGLNGEESANECCLLDEGFAQYAGELMSYYAQCGFERMMLDDDIRSVNHCNGQTGCFCDLHLNATAQAYGKPLTRQQLMDAFTSFDEESLKIKECYRKINFEGQLRFIRTVEQMVHAVDPNVQLGQMASGVEADQFQGRDMLLFLQTLAGEKHRPFLRPPGGAYAEILGDALLHSASSTGQKYRVLLGDAVDYVSEVEVFSPRNIFTKSQTMLDLQMQVHALTGFDYLSLNIFDHFGTPPQESIEYLNLLKNRKPHYEMLNKATLGKKVWGIGIPVPDNYVESLKNLRFGLQGTNSYDYLLQRLGLPVCYEKTDVNFVTAELLQCYNDEQVLQLLKGGVILEEMAVKDACQRGFGKYLGVEFAGAVTVSCYEELTGDAFNGDYENRRYPAFTANVHANETTYMLKPLPGARELTRLVDAQFRYIAAGTVYYENELGGKVLCLGTAFTGNNLLHRGRRHQFHSVVLAMFGEKLPFDVEDAIFVTPLWYQGEQEDLLALYNFSADEQIFTLRLPDSAPKITLKPLSIELITL